MAVQTTKVNGGKIGGGYISAEQRWVTMIGEFTGFP